MAASEGARLRTVIVPDAEDLARLVADRIVAVIRRETADKGRCVLGLASGHTPLRTYGELVRRCRAGQVSFSRVVTFNLDEYWPMAPDDPRSYRSYERAIRETGGIDFQLLGIGKDGHIGFNEPGSSADSRTRLVALSPITRGDAAAGFGGVENVPREAITVGVATILEAREIALLATGAHKAAIVRRTVDGAVTPDVVATFLQRHPNATAYLDRAAASQLTRMGGQPEG